MTLLIDNVVDFYGRYLSCSVDQLEILALWTFHTHCFRNAPFSPALNIHSREKQSGKTTCLELLQMLCARSFFHTSPSPALVIRQTQGSDEEHPFIGALLLDDCRFTTALQGVLSAGFRWSGRQVARSKNEAGDCVFQERINFFPKAFAGNHRLPDCLRDISIPIALEPKQPGSPCRRFHQDVTQGEADHLRNGIHQWYKDHKERLAKTPSYLPSQFPSELSSRQQDCAEPLLHIADLLGGDWPQRARNALVNAFALSAFENFHASKQLLLDVHDLFAAEENSGWISTKDALEFLHVMDDRTWDEWSKGKPLTSKDLAALLAPFGIKSKNHRTGEGDKIAKGYNFHDLLANGKRYIVPELFRRSREEMATTAAAGCGEGTPSQAAKPVAAESQNSVQIQKGLEASSQKLEAGRSPVAADPQNQLCGTAAPGCGEGTPGLPASPVAADSKKAAMVAAILGSHTKEDDSASEDLALALCKFRKTLDAELESGPQGKPRNASRPVVANSQNSVRTQQNPGAVLRSQFKEASPVAANSQKSNPNAPKPVATPNLSTLLARHPRLQVHIQSPARVRVAAHLQKSSPGHQTMLDQQNRLRRPLSPHSPPRT